jgi:photosystem II stability/assembly factor-like uncharacterized protein
MNRRQFVVRVGKASAGLVALPVLGTPTPESIVRLARYSAPRFDAWQIIGPGGGGSMFSPAVSPHKTDLVLVACDMTGAYVSKDGGDSWRMFDLRSRVFSFTFDPNDSRAIYATTDQALWRSTDTGETWALLYPPPESVKGIIMPDDHASPIIETLDGPSQPVTALSVDPSDSEILYAAIGRPGEAALHVSKDWGAHWERNADLRGDGRQIYIAPQSPKHDRTLYVVRENSIVTRKAGRWKELAPPADAFRFRDVSAGFTPGGELTIYAVGGGSIFEPSGKEGLFISDDGGAQWRQAHEWFLRLLDLGAPFPQLSAVATCARHPQVAYVSYTDLRTRAGLLHGVAKTSDGGRSWQLVWKEAENIAPNIHDAWLDARFGAGWGEPGLGLGVAPTNPNICYRSDEGALLRTTDGGRNWQAVYSNCMPDHTYVTTGLDVTSTHGVFFDPFDLNRVFIAYTDIGLFRSENGGRSWISSTTGVPDRWVNTTYGIVFDPAVKDRVWGVMSGIHDLPRAKMWRHQSPASYMGGVCFSEDGGKTWAPSHQGMPPTAATDILLDPTSPVGARVLYVAGFGKGVFKSIDGGKTWRLKNDGLPVPEPFAWRIARDKNGVLYLVIARRSEDGSFGNIEDGGLYRSTGGADRWEKMALPEGVNGPNWIAIDPTDTNRLVLAVWGRRTLQGAVQGGIYLSTDAGKSWRNVLSRDQHIYAVTIDPDSPNVLYAAGFESSAWRSRDRGETWSRIKGFNFKWGQQVILDPVNRGMIFIATYGGSVWYGPAAGDPHAVEDIVTPVVAYGIRMSSGSPLRLKESEF